MLKPIVKVSEQIEKDLKSSFIIHLQAYQNQGRSKRSIFLNILK